METTLATNFYNKTTADSTFYNKTTADSTFYNKTQTDFFLATKQNALQPAAAPGAAQVLSDLNVVKCLTTTSPVTFTDANDKITIGLNTSALQLTVNNQYWAAGFVSSTGTVNSSVGRYSFTASVQSATQMLITFTGTGSSHPLGANMVIIVTPCNNDRAYVGSAITATQFRVNYTVALQNFYFMVLAPV